MTKNINQLHKEEYIDKSNVNPDAVEYYGSVGDVPRIYPNNKKVLVKKGVVKTLTVAEAKELIKKVDAEGFSANIEAIIEFKTDKEGNKLANQFRNLAKNPSVNLKVTFKKID